MQCRNDLSKRCGEHRSIFFIEGEDDLARPIDCVGSIQHVPFNFSGLRPVRCLDPSRFYSSALTDPIGIRSGRHLD